MWILLTGSSDRHRQTYALAHKQTSEVNHERRKKMKNSIAVTVYSCHNYSPPLPHRHTHPHSPTRQMHLPAKIRPERENTFPEISVTYTCEHTRKQVYTHTHARVRWCRVSHCWFHCFHFSLDCLFILAVCPQGANSAPVNHGNPEGWLCCPSSIASVFSGHPDITLLSVCMSTIVFA